MEQVLQVTAVALIGSILCMILRRDSPVFAYVTALFVAAAILTLCFKLISPILSFLRTLQALTGLQSALFPPVYKTITIGAFTQLASGFCEQAGEQALHKIVQLCGMLLALYTALPLLEAALELLRTMTGG